MSTCRYGAAAAVLCSLGNSVKNPQNLQNLMKPRRILLKGHPLDE